MEHRIATGFAPGELPLRRGSSPTPHPSIRFGRIKASISQYVLDVRRKEAPRRVSDGTPDDYVRGRIERVNLETGAFETVYEKVGPHSVRGPNDIVFDSHGGFYYTDPGKTWHRHWDRGTICYGKADGSMVKELVAPIHKPNGIGLSPDGKTLYVAETETARLWAWDLMAPGEFARPATGSPESPHGSRLVYASSVYQRFDSLKVEANGNICIGTLDRGGITVVHPTNGTAEFVPVPGDTHCTNLCFGGPDLRKAYVTQSYAGRLVEIDWPRPGLALHNNPATVTQVAA